MLLHINLSHFIENWNLNWIKWISKLYLFPSLPLSFRRLVCLFIQAITSCTYSVQIFGFWCTLWLLLSWDLILIPLYKQCFQPHSILCSTTILNWPQCGHLYCNCHPGQLCKADSDTAAKQRGWQRIAACVALALETSATATLASQLTTGRSNTRLCHLKWMRWGTVCLYKCYFDIWLPDCEPFIRAGKLKYTNFYFCSHSSSCSVVFRYLFTHHGNLSVWNGRRN